ncbi:hypothetical protein EZV61_00945 [Corallincola luteus]|uniref:MipA/OmpV family protein n=1 Tax=Corallincola luteus TaxID=1775177 RepID=A0ABY2AMZ5_9GAMM|nr:MipA/OmpV family protein [Corallincola luteus]TCI04578.1 hypothetical protein EZV61_00945 [Corallincola luteus]
MRNVVKALSLALLVSGAAQATEVTDGVATAGDRFPNFPLLSQQLAQQPEKDLQVEYRGAQFVVSEASSQPLFSSTKHSVATLVEHSQDLWEPAFDSEEEKDRVNLGAEYRYQDFWGTVAVSLVSELSEQARGEYGKLSYSYPLQVTGDLKLFPEVSYTYMNGEYAEHYLGQPLLAEDGSAVTEGASKVSVGVAAKQGLSESWQLNYNAAVGKLEANEAKAEAPVYEYTLGVGVAYSF